ncbi:MAG: tetratricopeptide repeat protein [Candidatus Obscuribacterales bacterium]|nr:tetratricopeptide repeat protein [Candidatus Obscuribacterales bacterium]
MTRAQVVSCLLSASLLVGSATRSATAQESWLFLHEQGTEALSSGLLDQAEEAFQRCLKAAESADCTEPGVCRALVGLALVQDRRGNFTESDRLYELATNQCEKATGNKDNHRFAEYLPGLADLYHRHGKTDKATMAFQRLLDIRTKRPPGDDSKILEAHEHFALFLRSTNHADEAAKHEHEAAQLRFKLNNAIEQ